MTDDKMRPNLHDQSEQTKPEQGDRQAQQSQASATAQPGQRAALGRRPLFRT